MGNRAQGSKPGDKIAFGTGNIIFQKESSDANFLLAFLSGAWSGLALALIMTPIELVKCQQQVRTCE